MTHIYDDYDPLLSAVWADMLNQADDELGEWMSRLLRDNIPRSWRAKYLAQLDEDVLERPEAFLQELLMRRGQRLSMTQRERDIQRIALRMVLEPFDREQNEWRLKVLASAIASGAEVANPAVPDEQELKRLMRDPRYWRDSDPELVKYVREGFKRLYGAAVGGQDEQVAPPTVNRSPRG